MFIVKKEFVSFEWDENKQLKNIEKHGIDFLRAARALQQPHLERQSDQNGESRVLAICPETERLITIVYTMRGDACRIISARAARQNERTTYRQIFSE
jgi:uncharacterized DUF497 family protein